MKRFYTAESVTEGHPDKLCDLIADSILDACLKEDENSKVACEVLATKGNIIVAGEITSRYEPQVFEIVRKVLESAGYEADGIHMDALIHNCLLYTSLWPAFLRLSRHRRFSGCFQDRLCRNLVLSAAL